MEDLRTIALVSLAIFSIIVAGGLAVACCWAMVRWVERHVR